MEPVSVLKELLKHHKAAAIFLLTGIGVFAAVSTIRRFGDDASGVLTGVYIVGFSVLVYILTTVVNDRTLKLVLSWFVTLLFICCVLVFLVSVILPNHTPFPKGYCLLRFWEQCDQGDDEVAETGTAGYAALGSFNASTMTFRNFDVLSGKAKKDGSVQKGAVLKARLPVNLRSNTQNTTFGGNTKRGVIENGACVESLEAFPNVRGQTWAKVRLVACR